MHRCYYEADISSGCQITVEGDEAIHIARVLRLEKGDSIEITSGNGRVYRAGIESVAKKSIEVFIMEELEITGEPKTDVTLFIGLTKATKLELVIQKAVELGVCAIVPVIMERCVVKIKDEDSKTQRFRRIASEATKQCKRSRVPYVSDPVSFEEAVKMLKNCELCFVPYESEMNTEIKSVFDGGKVKSAGFIIGPEGGFSDFEADLLKKNGIQTVTLGKRILRMETAAIAVLSVVMYELGEMSN